jgi:hypothetical protein
LRRLRNNGFRYRRQHERLSMWRQWNAPNTFDRMLDRALAAQEKPYLSFAIRSSIGVGKSFENVDRCLHTLLNHSQRKRFVFATPEEAMAILDSDAVAG